MEQNLPLVAKKVLRLVQAILYMMKKNISKTKLLLDLNLLMKRGKVAGKALQNLMHHHQASTFNRRSPPPTQDYEFSCSNTPVNPLSLFTTHKRHHKHKKTSHKIKTAVNNKHEQIFVDPSVIKALEMLTSAAASPAVHGFGRSPIVRQLRVTDSPFPLSYGEEDSHVDEAAEKFIMKFYNDLRTQG